MVNNENRNEDIQSNAIGTSPRGSYQNPKLWNETGNVGDVYYYPEYRFYFRFLSSGYPSVGNRYFPTKPENNSDWKFLGGFNLGLADWMSSVPDNTPLNRMSIPGTHDSCTYTYHDVITKGWVRTQNWSIEEQLNNGIRFLDLRCSADVNGDRIIWMYHGKYDLKIKLTDVLSICKIFLDKHPLETILLSIQKEHGEVSDIDFIRCFNFNTEEYESYLWEKNTTPNLIDVRKKMVIVSRVSGLKGLQWSEMDIEDYSEGALFTNYPNEKVKRVESHLVSATSSNKKGSGDTFVTFLSINPVSDVFETNFRLSSYVNEHIYMYLMDGIGINKSLSANDTPYLGIMPMDFPDNYTHLIKAIVKFNDHEVINHAASVSMYNTEYNNYIYASSLLDNVVSDNTKNKRRVVGWRVTDQPVSQGTWKIVQADDSIYLFNTYYKEFIYASCYVKDDRRSVCGWILGVQNEIDDACMWYLYKQAGDVFTIKNKSFGEYFYATSLYDGDNKDNRRKTACWHKGNVVSQAFFKLR
ncbi:phosphatidylinositol-specific phospholipase C domain-containing protein [Pectobacterium polonicum]|uniref:1-phosphatidylinositol phosphodiesterase n=1 Tax=Pectobacterium polonicum TaxID=2485124 RepID=A0AAE9SY73_9GAMM|nr:phosphatidylinositol-specific phospholipase C domain-containing protein [Pectobacterium polonicum]UVO06486.1 phosphatidylinositol-specific phospholipase C domain-containing protein [Pectobacterium polonicum]